MIERLAKKWLDYNYDNGDEHQYQFYRCDGCKGLVTWKTIRQGGCDCGLGRNLHPACLSLFEKFKLLFMPWMV